MSETVERASRDAAEELAELRAKVEALMAEQVGPTLGAVAGKAEDAVRRAGDEVRARADDLADQVRERPLVAIGLAALAGYLLARLSRG